MLEEKKMWLCWSGLGDDSNTSLFQHGNDKTTEKRLMKKKWLCWPGPGVYSNTVTTKRLKSGRGGRRAGRRLLSKAWTAWQFQHGNDKTTESAPSATESRAGQGLGWAIIPTRTRNKVIQQVVGLNMWLSTAAGAPNLLLPTTSIFINIVIIAVQQEVEVARICARDVLMVPPLPYARKIMSYLKLKSSPSYVASIRNVN
ncbi:hypothetical protein B0H11DRAFT_2203625 [Mycena galericulata]|nr:hypothetical protein B0H11DRAFT_2203625 [Mycena galericulata]